VLQVVRERDGLDELLEAGQAVPVAVDAVYVVLYRPQQVLYLLDAFLRLLRDLGGDGLVELADSVPDFSI
jgi:hypothetical protein